MILLWVMTKLYSILSSLQLSHNQNIAINSFKLQAIQNCIPEFTSEIQYGWTHLEELIDDY